MKQSKIKTIIAEGYKESLKTIPPECTHLIKTVKAIIYNLFK